MTYDEAADILDQLEAGYPRTTLDPGTAERWIESISRLDDPQRCRTIARRWAEHQEQFPTLAAFLAAIRPRPVVAEVDPDAWVKPHPDFMVKHLALARAALVEAAIKARAARAANVALGMPAGSDNGHCHGGPHPCQRCGWANPARPKATR